MKKLIMLFALYICLLGACDRDHTITGQVMSASPETGTQSVLLTILDSKGKETNIYMDAATSVMSSVDGADTENFKKGNITDVIITAYCNRFRSSFTGEDGKNFKAYKAKYIFIDGLLTENALKLADGTYVDILKSTFNTVYRLKDGTRLLQVQNPSGPDNVYVAGVETFDRLSKTAQAKILEYFTNRGLLYDVNAELEKAYTEYKNTENKSTFSPYLLSQEIAPIASNEKIIYFLTSVTLPLYSYHVHEIRTGTAFNRETGEHISIWDLFSCSEEEAKEKILDMAGISEPALRSELIAAFKPEHIIIFPSNIEVHFPKGNPAKSGTNLYSYIGL